MSRVHSTLIKPESQPAHQWAAENQKEIDRLTDLLNWLAPLIRVRDGNGRRSDKLCILCTRLGAHRELVNGKMMARRNTCRHQEIFEIATDTENA